MVSLPAAVWRMRLIASWVVMWAGNATKSVVISAPAESSG